MRDVPSAGRDASDVRRFRDQGAAVEPGRFLDGADRAAALIAVEVDPVAGMRPAQGDDAGAHLARRIAPDIGQPPFVARPAPKREEPWHPMLRGLAQALDDQVEIVAIRLRPERPDVVEVDDRGIHWNTSGFTTPVNQLRSLRTAMKPKPGP